MRLRVARRRGRRPAAGFVLAVLALGTLGVLGTPAFRRSPERRPPPAVVGLSPAGVRHLVVEVDGRRAELTRRPRTPGGWSVHPGTPPQSAPLLSRSEDELFPLLAYRMLRADPADPQYGLVKPAATVRLQDLSGNRVGVRLGEATFTGAGFYASRDGDPERVYLVPRNTVDLLRSLIAGERTSSADPRPERDSREPAGADREIPVYLRQVLDTGADTPPPGP